MLIVAMIKINGENQSMFYQLHSDVFIKGCGLENIRVYLQHEADQSQLFRKLSNCLEVVLNNLSQFSLLLERFFKASSETCLRKLLL